VNPAAAGNRAERPRSRHESGFTLTELLVAMVLSGVVMAALYAAYVTQMRAHRTTEDVTIAQQNLRSAMLFVERDLRMAGYDPEGAEVFGFTNITSSTQTNVRFTLDSDEDGILSGASEYVAYQYNPGDNTLERDTGSGFMDVANYISGVTFVFYGSSGVTTSAGASIRSVNVMVTSGRGGHNRDLSSRILCRNVGL
jgi:type IV pilus assembly protein PilW